MSIVMNTSDCRFASGYAYIKWQLDAIVDLIDSTMVMSNVSKPIC